MGCWLSYLSGARCRFAYGPADPTATCCLLLQEIQIGLGFTFLVPAHPGSRRQNPENCKMVVVVVVVVVAAAAAALVVVVVVFLFISPLEYINAALPVLFPGNCCILSYSKTLN